MEFPIFFGTNRKRDAGQKRIAFALSSARVASGRSSAKGRVFGLLLLFR